MKITAIKYWQVGLPLREGRYSWSGGNYIEVFDSTVVAVETDAGLTGYAECCPLGSAYLPAYAKGVRAGLEEIGPRLIGMDPLALRKKFGRSLHLWGGVDKRELAKDNAAIDAHLRTLQPLIADGGFIPTVDHLVPPDVPLANFEHYMRRKHQLHRGEAF